jgi:lysophospholipase L1-like esterase
MTRPSPTAAGVARGGILLVTIGANDLTPLLSRWRTAGCPAACYSPAVGSDVRDILTAAKALRGHRPTQILVTDCWNVFADGDIARASDGPGYLRWSDELIRVLNSRICSVALLAAGGDHPNTAGNQLISSALLAATATPSG